MVEAEEQWEQAARLPHASVVSHGGEPRRSCLHFATVASEAAE
jgi:hypothetical protein